MTRILIVEDDPAVANMLELTLGVEGYETELFSDGDAVLPRFEGEPVALAILDVMVPGRDGYGVLEKMREHPAWADTKVMLVSALKSDDDVWKGWTAGADYYLPKPFDLDHLRDIVNRLIAGSPVN